MITTIKNRLFLGLNLVYSILSTLIVLKYCLSFWHKFSLLLEKITGICHHYYSISIYIFQPSIATNFYLAILISYTNYKLF